MSGGTQTSSFRGRPVPDCSRAFASHVIDSLHLNQGNRLPPVLTFAGLLDESFGCVSATVNEDYDTKIEHDGVADGVIEALGNVAEKCVETAYELVGKELKQSFSDVITVLDSVPELGKTIREGIQFAELGQSAALATTTAERASYNLTKSPFFQTPDGNIKCGLPNFTWWENTPPPPGADPQLLTCAITKLTISP